METGDSNFALTITPGSPHNVEQWNRLALKNSNLTQTTYYDAEEAFYKQSPIYIEVKKEEVLVAGLKVYYSVSARLPSFIGHISSILTEFGEILFDDSTGNSFYEIKNLLTDEIKKIIREKKITVFNSINFYGDEEKIIHLNVKTGKRTRKFSTAIVKLGKTEEELWQKIHPSHRRHLLKAQKSELEFFKGENIHLFNSLLQETYKRQNRKAPPADYISHHYEVLHKEGFAELFFLKNKEQVLAAALMHKFGTQAYYAFGGTLLNNVNAGHFLQWKILLQYNKDGITDYNLGEIADEPYKNNIKFSSGITPFKTRFGTVNISSASYEYIIKPLDYWVWKWVQYFISFFRK